MSEYGWIKHFRNQKKISNVGTQESISWSQTNLNDLVACSLLTNDCITCHIIGPGEYHQSDDFEVSLFNPVPKLLKQRLQYKISNWVKYVEIFKTKEGYVFICSVEQETDKPDVLIKRNKFATNQWLTVEYDVINDEVDWKFLEYKI